MNQEINEHDKNKQLKTHQPTSVREVLVNC